MCCEAGKLIPSWIVLCNECLLAMGDRRIHGTREFPVLHMQVPEVDALRAGGLLEALFERGAECPRRLVASNHSDARLLCGRFNSL